MSGSGGTQGSQEEPAQFGKCSDACPGIRHIAETIFREYERNPGVSAGVRVSLGVSHIYRGSQGISLHQHQKCFSFGNLRFSKTEVVFDIRPNARAFHRDLNISKLAVAHDE